MSDDPAQQERVHAMVPKQVKENFARAFPYQGAYQYAIRLILEVMPAMIDRDAAYREILLEEMRKMYADDVASREQRARPLVDMRQLDIPFAAPLNDQNAAGPR
jgi:hypothetical protein